MSTIPSPPKPMPLGEAAVSATMIGAVLFLPAIFCLVWRNVSDTDIWWHMRSAEWILEHGRFPTVDPFTQYAAGNPWAAYSWLYDLLLYGLHQLFGPRGVVVYTAALSVGIAAAFCGLVRRCGASLPVAGVLTVISSIGLAPMMTPRPWLFTILLFIIELDLLLEANRTGNRQLLLWLIPLFGLWANLHIQMVMGLAVLGIAVAESLLVRKIAIPIANDESGRMPFRWMLMVFGLCFAATLVNPYHWRIYHTAIILMGQRELWDVICELLAMPMRNWANWVVLGVALSAAFALGWRRKVRLLLPLLLLMAAYLGFRSQRDAWLVLVVGMAVLACTVPRPATLRRPTLGRFRWAIAAVLALLVLGCTMLLDRSTLRNQIAQRLPAQAVEFIRQGDYSGPMFNSYAWGGFLMFHLPEIPVSIDGRSMVHGEERVHRNIKITLCGKSGWRDDPELVAARLIVLPSDGPLAGLLTLDEQFQVLYEDPVATVFTKTQEPPEPQAVYDTLTQSERKPG